MEPRFLIREAQKADLDAINAIYNREVLEGVATWDEEPWSADARAAWFAERSRLGDAVLVAERADVLAGFGYLSPYRARSGWRFTHEDTLYIAPEAQRSGAGAAILEALIRAARVRELHALIAVIEAGNVGSIALHERFGFGVVGTKREVGFKFGRWLDLVEMQLLLS
jgi:L-amino acid N-acyltransferase YncA